jgi:hypothetical protein
MEKDKMTSLSIVGAKSVRAWLGLAALGIGLASAVPALALTCPAPQPLTRPGVLKETPSQTAVASALLASGDDANRIGVIVADLRARYPGVENAEIVNYLVTADCPVVAKLSGLSDAEKQTRMDRFVQQLTQFIY